ncbi:phage tail protein [Tenacibaculum xiamenense]|uniref:phage tail protein n=1 Tax=Tenacibaculum xiamenense TaxID=1261553 RepID=UPI0038930FE6
MFTAKKNIVKPSPNTGLANSNFIQPKMKVVKSDDKKEEATQKVEKAKENTQNQNTFFAPKVPIDKKNSGDKLPEKEEGKQKENQKNETKNSSSELPAVAAPKKGDTPIAAPKKEASPNKNEVKKDAKDNKDKETQKEKKEEVGKEEQQIPKAPTRPEDDPAFQEQIKQTEKVKEEKSQHPEPDTKVSEQKEAGHASPATQSKKNDQAAHSEAMNSTSEAEKNREPFTPEGFKKMLQKNLDDLEKELPKNSDEAKKFRDEKPINKIKDNISGQVTAESDKLAGPMKSEADKPAPATGQPTQEAKPLPPAAPGKPPAPLNSKAAIPKPKTSQEISMEKESQSLDDYMVENEVTDDQLAKSNEPKFTGALEEKNTAQKEAKLAPVKYRKKEQAQLAVAKKVATGTSKDGLDQMQAAKLLSENNVLASQGENKTSDKTEQEKIYAEFEKIYEATKKTVTDSLEKLSESVDKKFSEEAESAQKTFEKNVEDGLGEIYGWTVIDDWLFGEDTEAIDRLFRVEKRKFVSTMNKVLDDISVIIANGLNGALDAIAEGKKKSKEKFDSLDESQKKLAEDAFNDFNDQYADLEDTVYEKQEELAADLAQSYKENVDSLQEKFDEIKEKVSAGWIGAAFNALAGVIKTILKIKDMLVNLLAAAVSAIGAIISDPIGFLSNLISGVKQGFLDFGANIKQHMIKGLIEWLTGSLGNVGITLPDNLFSLSGIFSLVTQMLGLTWDYFRSKAVKLLGEPVVAGMEKAVEIFQIVRKDGVEGLWQYIKDQFSNLKEMVMDAIRDMIITKVVEAGIKWILGLLSPAGAFVKAAMMIIDIVKFFVERAAQIFELVNAFINSIKALAAGNVKAVAKGIETALAKAIPVLIGFLASLLGITGLTSKIQKIIKKVRKKIDKAINKIIKKAKKAFKKLVKKGKAKVKGVAKKLLTWWKSKFGFKTKDGHQHNLLLKGGPDNPKVMVASKLTDYEIFLTNAQNKYNELKKEKSDTQSDEGDRDKIILRLLNEARTKYTEIKTKINNLRKLKKDKTQDKDKIEALQKDLRALKKDTKALMDALMLEPGNDEIPETAKVSYGTKFKGFASSMTVKPLTFKGPSGSGPNPNSVGKKWKDLLLRRTRTKKKGSYYILGHLLNDNLHGPGEGKNLTPLTRGANKDHSDNYEEKIKKAVFKGAVVYYKVTVQYGISTPTDADVDAQTSWSDDKKNKAKKIIAAEKEVVPKTITLWAYNTDKDGNELDTTAMGALPPEKKLAKVTAETVTNNIESIGDYVISDDNVDQIDAAPIDDLDAMLENGVDAKLAEAIYEEVESRKERGLNTTETGHLGNIPSVYALAWQKAYKEDIKLIKLIHEFVKKEDVYLIKVGSQTFNRDDFRSNWSDTDWSREFYENNKESPVVLTVRKVGKKEKIARYPSFDEFFRSGALRNNIYNND